MGMWTVFCKYGQFQATWCSTVPNNCQTRHMLPGEIILFIQPSCWGPVFRYKCIQGRMHWQRPSYKLINPRLENITHEICLAQSDLTTASSSTERHILRSLEQRLDVQVSRCQHLHSSLGMVRAQSSRLLEVRRRTRIYYEFLKMGLLATKHQHATDISQLESMVISSQELLRKQSRKHAEQMDRLVSSDRLLDKLCQDNLDIMDQLRDITKKCDFKWKLVFNTIFV